VNAAATSVPNPRLASALDCARRGWAIFPVYEIGPDGECTCGGACGRDAGKHPRTQHGFKDATTDEAQIVEWWAMWPHANIGIATGEVSKLTVLDEDPRHDGHLTRAAWEHEHGPLSGTVRARTGRGDGGGHYYFGYPPGGRISTRKIGPGIDMKANGGYVVAPGSNHASGGLYTWEPGAHPDDIAVAPMPDWLLKRVTAGSDRRGTRQERARDEDFPETDLLQMEKQCGWLRHCRDDAWRGDDADLLRVGEPEWFAAMSIYARCKDGERLAHERSQPYPSYSRSETAEKLRHAREDGGPRTCGAVAGEDWGRPYCMACPHFEKITTPLQLGRPDSIESAWAVMETALQRLKDDGGVPFERTTLDALATLRRKDEPGYMRARDRFRKVRVPLRELDTALRRHMMHAAAPDEAPDQARVLDAVPDAPVRPDAVVPAGYRSRWRGRPRGRDRDADHQAGRLRPAGDQRALEGCRRRNRVRATRVAAR